MREPESLTELAADLRALSGRERRFVLDALSAAERSRLTSMLGGDNDPPAGRPDPGDGFDIFAPWLAARLRNGPEGGAAGAWHMTGAARQSLQLAAREWLERNPQAKRAPREASLVEALAARLVPRRRAS